ncbi:hypothetical protein ACU8KH_04964 [Lachancea thermotolerans]
MVHTLKKDIIKYCTGNPQYNASELHPIGFQEWCLEWKFVGLAFVRNYSLCFFEVFCMPFFARKSSSIFTKPDEFETSPFYWVVLKHF